MAQQKKTTSAHDLDRIIVRLPEGMREKIAELAEANGRSMTAEVVAALEQHLKGPDRLSAVEAFIARYEVLLDQLPKEFDKLQKQLNDIADHAMPPKDRS